MNLNFVFFRPSNCSRKRLFQSVYTIFLLFVAGVWINSHSLSAQTAVDSLIIYGVVRDAETTLPLRGARIVIESTKQTARTNSSGIFKLVIPKGTQKAIISKAGYEELRAEVEIEMSDVCEYLLEPVNFNKDEFVVEVDPEDPITKLIRKTLERKAKQVDSIKTYSYTLYTKFITSADTVTANRSSGYGDTTIVFLFESYSRGYYEKPERYFNEIFQRRQSANVPPRANFVAFGTNINAYDDIVILLDQEIATPFHPNALEYYSFQPIDTIDARVAPHAIRFDIKPKTSYRPLFTGIVVIDTLHFTPIRVALQPSKTVRLPFDAALLYEQEFSLFEKKYIMPTQMRIEGSAETSFLWVINPRVDASIYTLAYNYSFNQPISNDLFSQRRVEATENSDKLDSAYWNPPVLPLSPTEAQAYQSIEMLIDNPDSAIGTNVVAQISNAINRSLGVFNRRPFSGIEDLFRYNRVHGAYFGVGFKELLLDERLRPEAKIGYGTSDNRFYYETGLTYSSDKSDFFSITAKYYDYLARRDFDYTVSSPLITLGSAIFKSDYGDYFYGKGLSLSSTFGFGQLQQVTRLIFQHPIQMTFFLKSETQRSAGVNTDFSLFGGGRPFRDNPSIIDGTMRSFGGELLFNYSPYRRIKNFGFQLRAEISKPSFLSSDFDFEQYFAAFLWRTVTLPLWRLDVRVQGGYSRGNVPPQRFFSLESALNGTGNTGLYRAMNIKEFYGDRFMMMTVEHNFGEVVPGLLRIPNVASFGLEFILTGGLGWSEFSSNTRNFTQTSLPATVSTDDRWYYEVGFGISRILLFLRFDVSARISQRQTPEFFFVLSTLGL
ncbi:MAG: DUF5686 family protein [Chloroherpetonaceae bacterium]|nr:DUF5686 family protein [Chloroherpetonaceae bacterium]